MGWDVWDGVNGKNGWVAWDECIGSMDGWMDGWMGGWMDG